MTGSERSKVRPILFSGEMVRAILAGRKAQTRRVLKPQPTYNAPWWTATGRLSIGGQPCSEFRTNTQTEMARVLESLLCPYGVPGGRLWVRETWAETDSDGGPAIAYKAGGYLIHGATGSRQAGDWKDETFPGDAGKVYPPDRWRPSIHMPRWASRLTLKITEVRVQRLQEISEEDARAEGVIPSHEIAHRVPPPGDTRARCRFAITWSNPHHDWNSNPWVWAITFRRML